jgi:hypothetical protein
MLFFLMKNRDVELIGKNTVIVQNVIGLDFVPAVSRMLLKCTYKEGVRGVNRYVTFT